MILRFQMKIKNYPFIKVLLVFVLSLSYFYFNSSLADKIMTFKQNRYISYSELGQGKPIILIHAFPTDQQLWKPQQEKLKQYFRVITLDLWGFGHSEITDGQAVTMTEYAEEVKQLLDQLHIKKAIIAGESMGGYIALAFLEKYPNSVEGLVLSDTQSIADTPEIKSKREASAVNVLEHGTSELINGFMPKALTSKASNQTKIFLQNILTTQTPTAIASALRGMALREDTSNIIANTEIPMLIITGSEDTLISPQQSQHLHELAKNSKLTIIPDAGHLSSLEQPEAWNQAVIDMFYQSN